MSKVPWLHWILIPSGATFHPFFSYDQQFPRYNVAQNQKCTEWNQNEFKHSTDKSNLYALNTYPGDANSFHFALRQKYLRDTRLLKTKICITWLQADLEHLTVKGTLCPLDTYHRGPNSTSFRSTITPFEISSFSFFIYLYDTILKVKFSQKSKTKKNLKLLFLVFC